MRVAVTGIFHSQIKFGKSIAFFFTLDFFFIGDQNQIQIKLLPNSLVQMLKKQKITLPDKISKLTLKTKSFGFMKIFTCNISGPKKFQKIRHYDLQLQGAGAISSCLKKKVQQIYLRNFYQIKIYRPQQMIYRLNYEQNNVSLGSFKIQSNMRKLDEIFKSQTDRQAYKSGKMRSYMSNKGVINCKSQKEIKEYRSQYGVQSQQSQNTKKSNLQKLLKKVREVNSQFKTERQDLSRNSNYQASHQQSRVISTGGYSGNNASNRNHQEVKIICHTSHQETPKGMSFCTYNNKTCRTKVQNYVKQQTLPYNGAKFYIKIDEQVSNEKDNLLSLRKWHKNQKRKIIMMKIKGLEKSLSQGLPRSEEYFNNEYDQNNYANLADSTTYVFPPKYSQAHLNYKVRQPDQTSFNDRFKNYLNTYERNY